MNTDPTTMSHSSRALRNRSAWPSCRAPIVGTNPTIAPGVNSLLASTHAQSLVSNQKSYSFPHAGGLDSAGPRQERGRAPGVHQIAMQCGGKSGEHSSRDEDFKHPHTAPYALLYAVQIPIPLLFPTTRKTQDSTHALSLAQVHVFSFF